MAKPLERPEIANSTVNLPSTGAPNKSQPVGTLLTTGYDKGQKPAAEEYNWLWDNVKDWIDYFETTTDTHTSQLAGIDSGVAVGSVMAHSSLSIPAGYMECTGAAVSRTTFADLFTAIGTTYGVGDGSTTFNIPDLRGEFIRGLDSGAGVDTGRVLGTNQADDFKSHTHTGKRNGTDYERNGGNQGPDYVGSGQSGTDGQTLDLVNNTGGTETRPRNVAMVYIIKAFGTPVDPGAIDLVDLESRVTVTEGFDSTANLVTGGWFKDTKTGFIFQWNKTTVNGVQTLPIAYPNAQLGAMVTADSTSTGGLSANAANLTTTTVQVSVNAGIGWYLSWGH